MCVRESETEIELSVAVITAAQRKAEHRMTRGVYMSKTTYRTNSPESVCETLVHLIAESHLLVLQNL